MIQSFWEIEKLDPADGRPVKRCGAGCSFVKNMMGLLYVRANYAATTSQTDIGGSARAILAGYETGRMAMTGGGSAVHPAWGYNAYKGEDVGIVLGTGTTAVAYNDYVLAAPILHGLTPGKLLYWGGLIREVVVSAPYAYFDIMRIFENQSGGDIIPTELGMQAVGCVSGISGPCFLICRDVLAAPDRVTLADTELLKVTYRIRVSV